MCRRHTPCSPDEIVTGAINLGTGDLQRTITGLPGVLEQFTDQEMLDELFPERGLVRVLACHWFMLAGRASSTTVPSEPFTAFGGRRLATIRRTVAKRSSRTRSGDGPSDGGGSRLQRPSAQRHDTTAPQTHRIRRWASCIAGPSRRARRGAMVHRRHRRPAHHPPCSPASRRSLPLAGHRRLSALTPARGAHDTSNCPAMPDPTLPQPPSDEPDHQAISPQETHRRSEQRPGARRRPRGAYATNS